MSFTVTDASKDLWRWPLSLISNFHKVSLKHLNMVHRQTVQKRFLSSHSMFAKVFLLSFPLRCALSYSFCLDHFNQRRESWESYLDSFISVRSPLSVYFFLLPMLSIFVPVSLPSHLSFLSLTRTPLSLDSNWPSVMSPPVLCSFPERLFVQFCNLFLDRSTREQWDIAISRDQHEQESEHDRTQETGRWERPKPKEQPTNAATIHDSLLFLPVWKLSCESTQADQSVSFCVCDHTTRNNIPFLLPLPFLAVVVAFFTLSTIISICLSHPHYRCSLFKKV